MRQVTITLNVPLCPTANDLATSLSIASAQLAVMGDLSSAQALSGAAKSVLSPLGSEHR